MKKKITLCILVSLCMIICGCTSNSKEEETSTELPTLTYIGHASIKIKSKEGKVIYVDPAYQDGDYSEEADYILVTHEHNDHNKVEKCTVKDSTVVIRSKDALVDGEYKTFDYGEIKIEAVPSGGNANHSSKYCVGYIITVDGITVYHAGDTSMYDGLNQIVGKDIDYAMYPIDGIYNMDAKEATEVADLIGAKNNIPIHEDDTDGSKKSDNFTAKGKLVLEYGETISITK